MASTEPRPVANFVAGEWSVPAAAGWLTLPSPSDGRPIGRVPLSPAAEVDRAVVAAMTALPSWRNTPVTDRVRPLQRFREALLLAADELAELVVKENGKTRDEALGSIRRGVESVDFACSAPTLLHGGTLQNVAPGIDAEMFREPVGVVAGITPFNFPVMIPLWMAPLAIACGNTFLLKPSERVPLSANRIAEMLADSGVPPGVLNVVHGARETVETLLRHPGVDAVAFVGSAPVARQVYAVAASHGKRVLALAGAKNHLVVLPDADLDRSVDAIVSSAFGQAGERCLAGSVVVAVGSVGDRLVERLAERVRTLPVGPGGEARTRVGPVIRADHRDRVDAFIARGVEEGAVVAARGEAPRSADGFYVAPVLFDAVRPEMTIAQEEIFGPVLSVIRVGSLEEAIAVVNRSRYGNAASVFTQNGRAAREFRERVDAGMLGVNIGVPAPPAHFPFVGWKGSVNGPLAATGGQAVEFYTRTKVVVSRWS